MSGGGMRPLLALIVLLASAPSLAQVDEDTDVLPGGTTPIVGDCEAAYARLMSDYHALQRRNANLQRKLEESSRDGIVSPQDPAFAYNLALSLLFVMLGGTAAGLTMGMVSLEPMEMMIIAHTEEKDLAEDDKLRLREDKVAASTLLPIIENHHFLLVTLLLMNSLANEALPIFLDKIVPEYMAIGLSMTLVLCFGEILPSSVFTGSMQLRIAAKFAPMVKVLMWVLSPIAWPIAQLLDWVLGQDHKGRYQFAELRAIVGIHTKMIQNHNVPFKSVHPGTGVITTEYPHDFADDTCVTYILADRHEGSRAQAAETGDIESSWALTETQMMSRRAGAGGLVPGEVYYVRPCPPFKGRDKGCTFKLYTDPTRDRRSQLTFENASDIAPGRFEVMERDEYKILTGLMQLTHMEAMAGMKRMSEVEMLSLDDSLTIDMMTRILDMGYSRLPVYEVNKHNIRGFILVKKLIVVSPGGWVPHQVKDMELQRLVVAPLDKNMLELLNVFQQEKCHIGILTNDPEAVRNAWDNGTEIPPDVHMAGIITLEDIIEKLLQEDIYDEVDKAPTRLSSVEHVQPKRMLSRKLSSIGTASKQLTQYSAPPMSRGPTLEEPLLDRRLPSLPLW